MLRQRLQSVLCLAILFAILGGCGPILSTGEIRDARRALDDANSRGAATLAVYEYVSAEEYYAKAREEWGRSDFQKALEYARLALEFANRATDRAIGSRFEQEATPVPTPTPSNRGEYGPAR